jgi:hypothetical protein
MKTCTGCKQTKAFTEFHKCHRVRDGLVAKCKACRKETRKKRYEKNPEKELTVNRKYRKKNIDKVRAHDKKRYEQNPEKRRIMIRKCHQRPEYKKRNNAQRRERRKTDPTYRLKCNLRGRLYHALKGSIKSASTMKLVGCSVQHVKDHLEKQFQPGMTWENQGKWHIDHMLACDTFDLEDPEEQRRCFHWTNLQPLWGPENSSKGADPWYTGEWDPIKGWTLERL